MVSDDLDALHSKFPACETLAFADLSTKMILVTNTDSPHQREALDTLCAEAALTLGPAGNPAIGDSPSDAAFIATRDQIKIFLRAESEPTDVLCCICQPDLDIPAFLSEARPCLQKISGGG